MAVVSEDRVPDSQRIDGETDPFSSSVVAVLYLIGIGGVCALSVLLATLSVLQRIGIVLPVGAIAAGIWVVTPLVLCLMIVGYGPLGRRFGFFGFWRYCLDGEFLSRALRRVGLHPGWRHARWVVPAGLVVAVAAAVS